MLFSAMKREITNETGIRQKSYTCMPWERTWRVANPVRQWNVTLIRLIYSATWLSYLWLCCHFVKKVIFKHSSLMAVSKISKHQQSPCLKMDDSNVHSHPGQLCRGTRATKGRNDSVHRLEKKRQKFVSVEQQVSLGIWLLSSFRR